jgi:bacteriorhodopsin
MIAGPTLYRIFAGVFALMALGFLVLAARQPARRRRFCLAVAGAALGLVIANALVSVEILTTYAPDGSPQPNARYIGYFISFPTYGIILGTLAGARTRLTAAFVLAIDAAAAAALLTMHVPERFSQFLFGFVLVCLLASAVLLFGPMTRAANGVSGERRLVFKKLRNLGMLVWFVVPVLGVLSAGRLGVLDGFSWLLLVSYMDLMLNASFGLLLYRSPNALDQVAGRHPAETDTSAERAGIESVGSFEFPSRESRD